MIKSICILFLWILSVNNTVAQDIFYPPNYTFDCDDEVKLPEQINTIYVYDGLDPDIEIKQIAVEIGSGEKKWVKKKADKNCLSANPDDCLVWCLVDDYQIIIYDVVIDTSATTDWFPHTYISRKKGKSKTMQVLCKDEISIELLEALRNRLYDLGYDVNPDKTYKKLKGKLNREFKYFQDDYNLPVGKWTVDTMEFLYQK